MGYTNAPTIVVIDDVHATEYLGVHRYLEMLEQLKSKNFTPAVIRDYPNACETGGTIRDGKFMRVLIALYGAYIEFPEELEELEVKSNKPYWRTKERW